jgi:hypothetical protein
MNGRAIELGVPVECDDGPAGMPEHTWFRSAS